MLIVPLRTSTWDVETNKAPPNQPRGKLWKMIMGKISESCVFRASRREHFEKCGTPGLQCCKVGHCFNFNCTGIEKWGEIWPEIRDLAWQGLYINKYMSQVLLAEGRTENAVILSISLCTLSLLPWPRMCGAVWSSMFCSIYIHNLCLWTWNNLICLPLLVEQVLLAMKDAVSSEGFYCFSFSFIFCKSGGE